MTTSSQDERQDPSSVGATPRSRAALQRDTAEYVAEMAEELVRLARSANLELLAYMLDIARSEAATAVHRLTTERSKS